MLKPPPDPDGPRVARTTQNRAEVRYESLRAFSGQLGKVLASLKEEHEEGLAPARILVRKAFVRCRKPYEGPVSDRKLPPMDARPPSIRIVRPNGIAHPFFLVNLFVAQCRTKPGRQFVNDLATMPHAKTGADRTWADFVAVPLNKSAQARKGGPHKGTRILDDNRRRQIQGAIGTLADDRQRLLHQPNAANSSRRYEDFQLLDETGITRHATLRRYTAPDAGDDVFSVPSSLYLNGWHQVLTPSELNFLFMLYAVSGGPMGVTDTYWKIESELRLRWYSMSPAAYGSHILLQELGLVDVVYPEGRDRHSGTFEGYNDGDQPQLHAFRILEEGFNKPAVAAALPALKSRT